MIDEAKLGWYYDADIPIGFGLGSSGAFVAAIYHRYIAGVNEAPLSTHYMLKKMEGFFHGSSSGMDPLVSFSQKALYKSETDELQIIRDPGWPEGYRLYLLDTGVSRSTGALVETYRQMLDNGDFKKNIERQLIPMVEHAIHFYLAGAGAKLEECVSVISDFQRIHFSSFIPEHTKIQWDTLTKMPGVFVKFCGAGGGGYFLVLTTPRFEDELPVNLIPVNTASGQTN
jgi:mevalonate kinase